MFMAFLIFFVKQTVYIKAMKYFVSKQFILMQLIFYFICAINRYSNDLGKVS